jgi:hypothetical protein
VGCFITSSEWLDVGYGSVVRAALLNGLGGISMHLLQPESMTFEGVMTTAIISCFEVGATPPLIGIRSAQSPQGLRDLGSFERHVSRSQLQQASRWTPLFRESPGRSSERRIRLGEIVRVSRGAVTGANDFFVLDPEQAQQLGLMPHVKPALTRAQEVFASDGLVLLNATRRLLLDPARHLDLSAEQNLALGRHLIRGERQGIPAGYICRHRTPWWHVGAKAPPIVATYMARQPPAFALNPDGMAILNVLHGLFPRVELDQHQLLGLVRFLNSHRAELSGAGRMYQGGLEKFEPREMEALEIPPPDRLRDYAGE